MAADMDIDWRHPRSVFGIERVYEYEIVEM